MDRFRSMYGASPLHLIASIASFAIIAYGFLRIFDSPAPESTMIFFIAAIFAHDLIAFPMYSMLNQIAFRTVKGDRDWWLSKGAVPPLNYIRIPAVVSGFLLLLYFPLIFRLSADRFIASSGQSPDVFLGRWLGIVAVLFTGSALLYALKIRRSRDAPGVVDAKPPPASQG